MCWGWAERANARRKVRIKHSESNVGVAQDFIYLTGFNDTILQQKDTDKGYSRINF